jgi:ABC-type glycerol-3-phosphate transport system substrate-binding protein
MKTKILFLIAMLAAAMLVFAACGTNDDPEETNGQEEQQPGPVDPAPPVDTTQQPEEVYVPAGPSPLAHPGDTPRVITIASWYLHQMHGAAPFYAPDDDSNPHYPPSDPEMAWMQWDNVRWVEEHFNVIIEHINFGDYGTYHEAFTAHQLAGTPLADIMQLSPSNMLTAARAGMLTDMAAFSQPGSDLLGANRHVSPRFVDEGGEVWSARVNIGGQPWNSIFWSVNNDLVARLGLEDPVALYEAGEWTWDAFLRISRQASAAGDYFGIGGVWQDIGPGLVASNDGLLIDGDLNYGLGLPNSVQAIELINTIQTERLWNYNRDYPPAGPEGSDEWTRSIDAGWNDANTVFMVGELWVPAQRGAASGIEWSIIPFPRGPANTSGNSWAGGVEGDITIPAGVENPELVVAVMEALMSWSGEDYWLLGHGVIQGLLGTVPTEADAQRLFDIMGQRGVDLGATLSFAYEFSAISIDLFNGIMSVGEIIEYHRGPVQERIDNMFR